MGERLASKELAKAGGRPVKNLDIIQDAFELFRQINHRVEVCHVRGHIGVEGNELSDRMAVLAIYEKCAEIRVYETQDVDSVLAMRAG